jgi:dipeptidyl aminopeptidase/acylaminoacyl peptidase
VNTIVRVDLLNHNIRVVAQGHDFYSSPALSPDGKKIAWITWDFPNMPWDSSQLWIAEIQNNGDLTHIQSILDKKNVAVFQPQWSPGGDLYVVMDSTGWYNLYRFEHNKLTNVYPASAEFGIAVFNFGFSTYSFINDHLIAAIYVEQGRGHAGLLDTRTQKLQELSLPYTEFAQIRSNPKAIYFIGVTTQTPPAVIQYMLKDKKMTTLQWSRHLNIKPDYFSVPQLIKYKTAANQISYGNYYPPKNPDYRAPKGEKPPLIVIIHGGPTSRAYWALDLENQYWTSRGYALLDLNYPGSTGYGRAYRNALNGQWGIADRDAAIAGALYLVKKGWVDPRRLIIKGASAGGYTVLRTLTTSSVFQVGTDYYGWTDLEAAYKNTHKFEAHYLDSLVGPYPQQQQRYHERSPLFAADKISGALLIFQGLQDPVVLPAQSEMMYQAVKRHGNTVSYVTFPDEGHGFRQAATLIRSLQIERDFYEKVLEKKHQ